MGGKRRRNESHLHPKINKWLNMLGIEIYISCWLHWNFSCLCQIQFQTKRNESCHQQQGGSRCTLNLFWGIHATILAFSVYNLFLINYYYYNYIQIDATLIIVFTFFNMRNILLWSILYLDWKQKCVCVVMQLKSGIRVMVAVFNKHVNSMFSW